MALSSDRKTPRRVGEDFVAPMAAAKKIYAGGIVCLNSSGYAVPAETAIGLTPVGRADETVDNTGGADGDRKVKFSRGTFQFKNSAAADEITLAEVGKVVYLVDDETVAKTSGANTRSRGGFVADVDGAGVWVLITPSA